MTPKPTLLLSPDGSFDQNGPVSPTIAGGVRVVPSTRNEWVETEATTNLVGNPRFALDVSGWSVPIQYPVSQGRVAADLMGDYAYQVVRSATTGWGYASYSVVGARPSTSHTFSLYIRCDKARLVNLEMVYWQGSTLLSNPHAVQVMLTPNIIQRLTFTTTPPAGTDRVECRLRFDSTYAADDTYVFSGVQFEQKPYATPYVDGDMEVGDWTGTPHASASTRKYSRVAVGKQINAWQVAEGTTNHCINPVSGLNAYPMNAYPDTTQARITDASLEHPTAGLINTATRVTATGSADNTFGTYAVDSGMAPLTKGKTFTIGIWVKTSPEYVGNSTSFDLLELGPSNVYAEPRQYVATGEWQYLENTITIQNDGCAAIYMYFNPAGKTAGSWIQGTAFQVEEKPYATPYCDGSLGAGHAWTGTPHASTSTRSAASLRVNNDGYMNSQAGTVLLRYRDIGGREKQDNRYLFNHGFYGYSDFIAANNAHAYPHAWWRNGEAVAGNVSGLVVIPAWSDASFAMTWNGEDVTVKVNDAATNHGTRVGELTGIHADHIWLGGDVNGEQHANVAFESAMFFDTALSDAEIAGFTGMEEAWTYNNTFGPGEVWAYPTGSAGVHLISTKIHESDMYGTIGDEITGEVIDVTISSDIDRAGSKNHMTIAAVGDHETLKPGAWVTPVQTVARNGVIESMQRFAFELGQPSVTTQGRQFYTRNSGRDIVDLLARSSLLDTFATPIGGHVMTDIELAIRMLGITSMGPNLIQNPGFEAGSVGGWFTYSPGPTWSSTWGTARADYPPAPEGAVYLWTQPVASAVGTSQHTTVIQDVTFAAGSMQRAMLSAFVSNNPLRTRVRMRVAWYGGVDNQEYIEGIDGEYAEHSAFTKWERIFVTGDVPPNATRAQCVVIVYPAEGVTWTLADFLAVDDVQLRAITGDLLPVSILALPLSEAFATSRIQHLTSDARLAAVNDRLASLGMMAVASTHDSKYTSRVARDPARDAASRVYEIDTDIRLVGEVETGRATTNNYNRVFAIKEDYTTGTSMTAIAENTDLDDSWSIHNALLEPKRVYVQDAVDLAALQLIADQELGRASIQEMVTLVMVPDMQLTVYDIIQINGPEGHPAIGKWAVEAIEGGATSEDPMMTVSARRTKVGE